MMMFDRLLELLAEWGSQMAAPAAGNKVTADRLDDAK